MARHQVSDRDRTYLRYAIELSRRSRDAGKHPFGALVVDARGSIVAEARNNALPPDGDPTQHAELVAVSLEARSLSDEAKARTSLTSSVEPCIMLALATHWC